ncbi:toxin-antitoxin system YwqK family antitoxin [Fusobacterium ulcerans]|uniref:toxin-antitoxin system YwqK family antitoxin n=1 Tax=Fusobacterium ulcerans TaxID=861 RepID=UPI0010314183|nr:toxin-antitoxin system YwqK family antitoxin [Fusobacterium ulcerans]
MKKIVLILIMFLLTLTGCGKERIEDNSKREIKNDKIYVIGENKPYTGVFIKKYENGDLAKINRFKNGILHGKQETYYKDGQLALIDVCKNGQLDGAHKGYYENRNLKTEATYRNGKYNGSVRVYYENGQLWSESKYKNGEKIAPTNWYDENGNPKPSL